jgi:phosphatidylserine/phosphatidylglycerophosphate/cardiolipin synthase-like enzyme
MSRWKRHRQRLYQTVLPSGLSRLIPGNQVTSLQNGETYFPALKAAFDRAQHDIYLLTYIYEQDAAHRRGYPAAIYERPHVLTVEFTRRTQAEPERKIHEQTNTG